MNEFYIISNEPRIIFNVVGAKTIYKTKEIAEEALMEFLLAGLTDFKVYLVTEAFNFIEIIKPV